MIVYIFMFLLSVWLMYRAEKASGKKKKLYCILSFLPFFLVSALRYGVGTDYLRRYVFDYNRIYAGTAVENLEMGFQLLMKATMLVTSRPYLMFAATSLMINGFIFFTIAKESDHKTLSIAIYFLLGFFFDSLNIMRQFLSIAVIFIGVYYLLRGKRVLYVLSVLIAATFHSISLVMLVLVVCDRKVLCSHKWFLPCIVLVLALNTRLLDIVYFFLQNTRFSVYFSGKLFKGEVSYLFIGENLAFYLLMLYTRAKGYVTDNRKVSLFLNTQALALLCMCLGACHMLFIRVAFFFSAFQILSVPYFVSRFQKTYQLSIRNRTLRINLITVLIVLCMLMAFYRTNIRTNVNEVVPYRFLFAKNFPIY